MYELGSKWTSLILYLINLLGSWRNMRGYRGKGSYKAIVPSTETEFFYTHPNCNGAPNSVELKIYWKDVKKNWKGKGIEELERRQDT